jgi:hypothetical protein
MTMKIEPTGARNQVSGSVKEPQFVLFITLIHSLPSIWDSDSLSNWYLGRLGSVNKATKNASAANAPGFGDFGMIFFMPTARKYTAAAITAIP